MQCPNCGVDVGLAVKETRRAPDGAIVRRRRCESCRHDFATRERVSGDAVRVRKTNGAIEAFDRSKLRKAIVKASVRTHHGDRISELIEAIVQHATAASEQGVIASTLLAPLVMSALKEFDPVTHVRFALTQLGRQDHEAGSPGWSDVEDVRRWLRDTYPELEHFRPSTKISTVVKRNHRREPYARSKMERSIGLASKGRGASKEIVHDLAFDVAEEVERELRNQSIVTSGQISAEIIRILRRIDHVAAIRFASTAKHFESVEDYETEALGLR